MKISRKDLEVFEFIKAFVMTNGVTPSVREISDGVGLKSLSSVHCHMKNLIHAGFLIPYGENTIRYSVRGLKIVEDPSGRKRNNT